MSLQEGLDALPQLATSRALSLEDGDAAREVGNLDDFPEDGLHALGIDRHGTLLLHLVSGDSAHQSAVRVQSCRKFSELYLSAG
jgi:hypothetical protein